MPAVFPIDSISDARVADYRDVRDAELLRARSRFMVEGRANVRRLIEDSAYRPRSLLLSPTAREALSDALARLAPEVPVYVAPRGVLDGIAGFDVHRGCLAVCDRPEPVALDTLLAPPGRPSRLVVLEGLSDPDNVGAVFRNAMAFGVDAVLLCPRCCDPLYRKAIRVSMGAALCVPSARLADWPADLEVLRGASYRLVALHPHGDVALAGERPLDTGGGRVALLLGTEGAGLSPAALARADARVRIPMREGFDSLNVATAAGIALHHLFGAGDRT